MAEAPTTIEGMLTNSVARIESLLRITDKHRRVVPFTLNPIQYDMLDSSTGRDIYVKPAQVGGSSGLIADALLDTITKPGTVSVIISYEEFITQRLLRKAQFFYDNLLARIPTLPKMHHSSSYEKTFPEIDSSLYIGSARSYVFGRGEAIHNAILDEYAFWDPSSVERITGPLLDRVPPAPYGKVKILSTPNGENNFRVLYSNARDGEAIGKSTFRSHFYPWYIHAEYQIPRGGVCLEPDKGELEYDAEEQALVDAYGLTEDQIRWRRYKIVEVEQLRLDGSSRSLFTQEYPEDDESCFLTSGDMYYDVGRLNELERQCHRPVDIVLGAKIWNLPEKDIKYYAGIDPGLGKVSHSVVQIWHFYFDKDGKEHAVHDATLGGLVLLSKWLRRWLSYASITTKPWRVQRSTLTPSSKCSPMDLSPT